MLFDHPHLDLLNIYIYFLNDNVPPVNRGTAHYISNMRNSQGTTMLAMGNLLAITP